MEAVRDLAHLRARPRGESPVSNSPFTQNPRVRPDQISEETQHA
jgi:hypothetical protein